MPESRSLASSSRSRSASIVVRSSSRLSLWNHAIQDLLQRGTWAQAMRVQRMLIRNAIGSIACAWAANACYSTGNIFSSKSSRDQSRYELIVSNVVWCGVLYAITIVLAHVPAMLTQRFISLPRRGPTVLYCVKEIVWGSGPWLTASLMLMFGLGELIAWFSRSDGVSKFKLEFYCIIICNHIMNTGVILTARQIYFQKTREGKERLDRRRQKRRTPVIAVGFLQNSRVSPMPSDIVPMYISPSFWRGYVNSAISCLPVFLAGGYVQLLSQMRIAEQSSIVVACFMTLSTLAKLILQESAKHLVIKKRIRSIRVMCILVAVPTVLIDTQARIVLLGMQDTDMAAAGIFGMAILEIGVRVGKAFVVTYSIRRRQGYIHEYTKPPVQVQTPRSSVRQSVTSDRRRSSVVTKQIGFELWRHQRQAYHTAELNADMYAEYIAIGCSTSILFFYSNHPHYLLLRPLKASMSESEVAARKMSQLHKLLLQVVVEIVVDYTSIVLEITAGIEFDRIKGLGSFLAALFGTTAVINIIISAMMFLD
ncbi:hypothetical protein PC129_g10547 [Phytophthora cactorum]|uniref:Uncharacterized protein n=2 Tax=Phytophthora cactorum TaxID=29920 RepID=A0A329RZB5_9STRA|nr:hypothetical protein PC112_g12096 [Phytophthora cactorum]KAG2901504.1 hypothetical protein PC114_g13129 [Phytophthora cactorum]KAG2933603.1 hypothetical protein PC117_g12810 [Phytophthora cactorum]KAG3160326.1 hypothetical protein C6341_g13825 [Phytophthora cactorum]KAG3218650.1 hypothetical protein PC129_g10547 [Phytophthora cactorum]